MSSLEARSLSNATSVYLGSWVEFGGIYKSAQKTKLDEGIIHSLQCSGEGLFLRASSEYFRVRLVISLAMLAQNELFLVATSRVNDMACLIKIHDFLSGIWRCPTVSHGQNEVRQFGDQQVGLLHARTCGNEELSRGKHIASTRNRLAQRDGA